LLALRSVGVYGSIAYRDKEGVVSFVCVFRAPLQSDHHNYEQISFVLL
jgi:hypothetical protein